MRRMLRRSEAAGKGARRPSRRRASRSSIVRPCLAASAIRPRSRWCSIRSMRSVTRPASTSSSCFRRDSDLTPLIFRLRSYNRADDDLCDRDDTPRLSRDRRRGHRRAALTACSARPRTPKSPEMDEPDEEAAARRASSEREDLASLARRIHQATNVPLFSPKVYAELFRRAAARDRRERLPFPGDGRECRGTAGGSRPQCVAPSGRLRGQGTCPEGPRLLRQRHAGATCRSVQASRCSIWRAMPASRSIDAVEHAGACLDR